MISYVLLYFGVVLVFELERMLRFAVISWVGDCLLLTKVRLLNYLSILLKKRCCSRVVAEEVSSDMNKIIFIRFILLG